MNSIELEEERRQQAVKLDYFQVLKNRYPLIILTLLLVLITSALISYLWTARYQATAKFQIYNLSNPVSVVGDASVSVDARAGGNFFQNQIEIIKSPELIRIAVENSDLPDLWRMNPDACVARIRAGLRVSPSINTEIVTLTFRDENRDIAKEVIARVVSAYETHRVNSELLKINSGLSTLDEMIVEKEVEVASRRQSVLDLINKYGIIPDSNTRWTNERNIKNDDDINSRLSLVTKLEDELMEAKTRADTLRGIGPEDLAVIIRDVGFISPSVERLHPRWQELKTIRQQLENEGIGPNHPRMRNAVDEIRKTKSELLAAIRTTQETLDLRVVQSENRLDSARQLLEASQDKSKDLAPVAQQYQDAQKLYERSEEELALQRMRRSSIAVQSEMYRHPIEQLQLPKASTSTVEPNWTLNFALGGALGLAMGIALAFILEISDTTVRSMEEIEAYLGVPVLAVIPRGIGVLTLQSGASPDAEAYRILRTNIEFNRQDNNANLMTIISGSAGEGKTTTLVNLAYVCAQGGYNTLVIDADLRRPQLHRYFETDNQVGLTTYLTSDLELEDVAVQTSIDHLFFVPSGVLPQDASGLLNSRRMSELLEDVKQRFDLVLIDSPPILGVSDGSVIVSMVDFSVAIVQHRKLPRKLLLRVKQVIDNAGGNLLGVVLNNVDIHSDSQYQYYTSYYTYYAAEDRDVAAAQTVQRRGADSADQQESQNSEKELY